MMALFTHSNGYDTWQDRLASRLQRLNTTLQKPETKLAASVVLGIGGRLMSRRAQRNGHDRATKVWKAYSYTHAAQAAVQGMKLLEERFLDENTPVRYTPRHAKKTSVFDRVKSELKSIGYTPRHAASEPADRFSGITGRDAEVLRIIERDLVARSAHTPLSR